MVEQVRNAIKVMRKYKATSRLIGEFKAYVAEDVFDKLIFAHVMTRDAFGKYFLDGDAVIELKDYPEGYISVE